MTLPRRSITVVQGVDQLRTGPGPALTEYVFLLDLGRVFRWSAGTSATDDGRTAINTSGAGFPGAYLLVEDEAAPGLVEIDGAVTPTTTITATADTAGKSITVRGKNGAVIRYQGSTTDLTGDLTLAAGTQDWNTSLQREGKVVVSAFDWSSHVGKFVRVVSGSTPGAMAPICKDLGTGAARVSGGLDEAFAVDGFAHFAQGDVVRVCDVTRWSGANYSFNVIGHCQLALSNIDIGASGATHETKFFGTGAGVLLFNSRVRGMDVIGDGEGLVIAGSHVICSHVLGSKIAIVSGTLFEPGPGSPLNMRRRGFALINQWNVFQGAPPTSGGSEGGGQIVVDEGNAVCDYASTLNVDDASSIEIYSTGRLWMRDAAGASVGISVPAGSGIHCASSASLPKIVGTHPTTDYMIDNIAKTQAQIDGGPGFSTSNARIACKT